MSAQAYHILVIDDSLTVRKMVDCHLSQAGYRVSAAADARTGLEMARSLLPDMILLDHQLPGTTGDEVCRQLREQEDTRRIPVVVSSSLRGRAFAQYADFANVIDQIPKPFTPELLKSGVANALAIGSKIISDQELGRTTDVLPEDEIHDAPLQGLTSTFSFRAVMDFLNNNQVNGRLTLDLELNRIRFAIAGGRIQAVYSGTINHELVEPHLPDDLADLSPLLAVTLAEQQSPQMSGLVKLLERSLSDPRRLRHLLRAQSAILTHMALTSPHGKFAFEAFGVLPPMFQAFPLQCSLPALAVEGVRRCEPQAEAGAAAGLIYGRQSPRGGNLDRAGLSPAEMKLHASFDSGKTLGEIASEVNLSVADAAAVARGLELIGLVERRLATSNASLLVWEEDPEAIRTFKRVLGSEGGGYHLVFVKDRVGAQLMLRRQRFDLMILALESPEQENFYRAVKSSHHSTRFVGIVGLQEEQDINRLDSLGIDGILHRPLTDSDLLPTVKHVLAAEVLEAVS